MEQDTSTSAKKGSLTASFSAPFPADRLRLHLAVRGAVQGVGFRPFVHRLAGQIGLTGWVRNSPRGAEVEVEGSRPDLETFLLRLGAEVPSPAFIQGLEPSWLDAVGHVGFRIEASETGGPRTALVLPDIATCPDCLRELFDPANRRHRYPFLNCTRCGPRFSLIEALPYDRANTSMKAFPLCPACRAEYEDPADRRFHAQPTACPVCGPRLAFRLKKEDAPLFEDAALLAAVEGLRRGEIAAVKGIGGFHLMVDARNEAAVRRLRERKRREEKPFALLFPSLAAVEAACEVSALEQRLLLSPEAPIVLLRKRKDAASLLGLADAVAPGNPNLGAMLPSNPLHHLLMAELGFPVVATSGNASDEPICTDEAEAFARLGALADFFLTHDRPIVRHVDDSIVRVVLDREMVLRRARGYAPLPVRLRGGKIGGEPEAVLAVGAHVKNAVALAVGEEVFVSQHIGDLETDAATGAFRRVVADLETLFDTHPTVFAADLHPDYASTRFAQEQARESRARSFGVQHHVAHVLSCIAENGVALPALGIAWDGTGYGTDGTVWGGEAFHVTPENVVRAVRLRPFRLPGGDMASREPRRAAAGLLHALYGTAALDLTKLPPIAAFSHAERPVIAAMLTRGLNSPFSSSVGRLFDAVASFAGLRHRSGFEGQAAIDLEAACDGIESGEAYPFPLVEDADISLPLLLDWKPMLEALLDDLRRGLPAGPIAALFHNGLAEGIVAIARRVGEERVVLSGGCFQNRRLTERTVRRLRAEGFRPYWHQRVPPNDGGIALGQVAAARWNLELL